MVIPKATGSYRHIHITHKFLRLHEMRRPYVFLSFIILKARVMVIVNIEGLNWIHCHYSDSEAPSTPFFRSLRFVGKKFRYKKKKQPNSIPISIFKANKILSLRRSRNGRGQSYTLPYTQYSPRDDRDRNNAFMRSNIRLQSSWYICK